jgi:SAM-dependent methyltransferase
MLNLPSNESKTGVVTRMRQVVDSGRLPERGAALLLRAVRLPFARIPWGPKRRCVLCGRRVGRFLPYEGGHKSVPRLLPAVGCVGSDVDNFECPYCGAHDRERHLFLYLQAAGLLSNLAGKAVLHIAPERRLPAKILAAGPSRYIRGDLFPSSVEEMRIDIEDMPFDDGAFDLFIANHVLEHVNDELAALAEIRRVLKSGGYAVLQTPFSRMLMHTWHDPGINTPKARVQAYGQNDHVRLFGRDIFERIAAAGFESHRAEHDELLSGLDAREFGVNPAEPFFLFRRVD